MNPLRTPRTSAIESSLPVEPDALQKYSDEVRERIAKKAYELHEQRGRQQGRDLDDWLEAEEIVMREIVESGH